MARLNIEDDLWVNIGGIIAALGDEDRAVGMVVRFLRVAQSRYQNGEHISEEEFAAKGFHETLIGRFAKRTPSGIQALGSEKHFAWLDQKKAAGSAGGKVSAQRARDENGRLLPKNVQADSKQEPSETKQIQASFSISSSSSISDSSKEENTSTYSAPLKARNFLAAYCDRFKKRWGHNPEILPKHAGIAKRVSQNLGEEKVALYLDAYFAMPDAWLVKTKHPIEAFETKLNEIVVFAKSGNFTTMKQAQQADSSVAVASQLQRIKEGTL